MIKEYTLINKKRVVMLFCRCWLMDDVWNLIPCFKIQFYKRGAFRLDFVFLRLSIGISINWRKSLL